MAPQMVWGDHLWQPYLVWGTIHSNIICHRWSGGPILGDHLLHDRPQHGTLGDGQSLNSIGIGNVAIELLLENGKIRQCHLYNVLCVPKLSYNLLSVSKITEAGKRVEFNSTDCQIVDKESKVVAVGIRRKSYYLSCQQKRVHQAHVSE